MKYTSWGVSLLCLNLCACDTLKSLFPDKEKDYQYTTEIPPLVLPADLTRPKSFTLPPIAASSPEVQATLTPNEATLPLKTADIEPAKNSPLVSHDGLSDKESSPKSEPLTVELISDPNQGNYLRINSSADKAWRLVSKALSRQSIEVVDRNQAQGIFAIQYDPHEEKVADGGYWEELVFMVQGFQSSSEYACQLKLQDNHQQTEVHVLNNTTQQGLSDTTSLELLKLLQKTIRAENK